MRWVKIDNSIPDHRKILTVGPLGLALQVRAICYCSRHLTNGLIPRAAVRVLTSDIKGKNWPVRMVAAGLWETDEAGFLVHDYLDFQQDEADVNDTPKQKSRAGLKGGIISGLRRRESAKQRLNESEARSDQIRSDQMREETTTPLVSIPPVEKSPPAPSQATTMFHVEPPATDGPTKKPRGDFCENCVTVIAYLNEAGGTTHAARGAHLDMLHARHQEYGVEACRKVSRVKAWDWIHSPQARERFASQRGEDMAQYFRPETLFRPRKFPQYMGERDPGEFWK